MSHNMLEHPSGLYVTRFCGPVRDDGGPRTMYQVTVPNGQYAQLTAEQWEALVHTCAVIAQMEAGKPKHRPHELCDCLHPGPCAAWHCASRFGSAVSG